MSLKPLKTLLAQADELIGSKGNVMAKEASAENNEVSALASLLSGADTQVTVGYNPELIKQAEVDNLAESLNRYHAAVELDTLFKLDIFEKRAGEEGFSEDQIEEVLSKLAAQQIAKKLPLLAALGVMGLGGEDKNSLPKVPTGKTQAKLLGRLSLIKGLGY